MHIQEPKSLELTKWWPQRAKKFESHNNHNVLHTYMFVLVPTCLFRWITSCLTTCFLLQNAEALAISTSSHRGGGCRPCLPYPPYQAHLYRVRKALPEIFLLYFQLPYLPAWRNLFSTSGIFCGGRYEPGCTGIFWPRGRYQPACHYF